MKKEMIYELVEKGFEDKVVYANFVNKFISKIKDEGYTEMADTITNIKNKHVNVSYATRVKDKKFSYLGASISDDVTLIKTGYKHNLVHSVFLHGKPGTGKTTFVHKLAAEMKTPLVELRMSSILDSRYGETIKKFEHFMTNNINTKQIIFIDEAESLFRKRGQRNDVFESDRLLTTMLKIMDRSRDAMVVLSSNLMKSIDRAILRRFDFFLNFDKVTIDTHKELEKTLNDYGIDFTGEELDMFVKHINKYSKEVNFSKINYVARRIALEKLSGRDKAQIAKNIKKHLYEAEIEMTKEIERSRE